MRHFLVVLVSTFLVPLAYGDESSTFNTGADGWVGADVAWEGSGGNPGGYLRFEDASTGRGILTAPDKFLSPMVDWTTLDGSGWLVYDHAILDDGELGEFFFPYCAVLSGGANSAEWTGDTPMGETDWTRIRVPITESAWNVTSGTWAGLMSNVEALSIGIEQIGSSVPSDIAGVDNIFLLSDCEDATWSNYGQGWPGTNGIPQFTASEDPTFCSTVTLNLENSLGADTCGFLMIGISSDDLLTGLGGSLLVVPLSIHPMLIPAAGIALLGDLPCDDFTLCGTVYLQVLELDSGASVGVSFTPGLELLFGV